MNKFILFSYPILVIALLTSWYYLGSDNQRLLPLPTPTPAPHALPRPTPKVASSSARLQSSVSEYVMQTFGKDASTAFVIMQEHNLDCNYGAGTRHLGLFAIDTADPRASGDLLNCINNIDVAKKMYDQEKFRPWGK